MTGPDDDLSCVQTRSQWRPAPLLTMLVLFTALNYIGSAIYRIASEVTTVKPFCGIALAIVLIQGRRALWPVLVTGTLGAITAKVLFGATVTDTVLIPVCASLCVYGAYQATLALVGALLDLRAWKQLVGFIAIAAAVCALTGVAFSAEYYFTRSVPFWRTWVDWTIATTLSFVIFTPVIVLISSAEKASIRAQPYRALLASIIFIAAVAAMFIPSGLPWIFLTPCALLLVTMTCELEGAALALAATQCILTVAVVLGYSPATLAHLSLGNQLYFTQLFMSVLICVMLPAAAAITERRTLRDEMAGMVQALKEGQARYITMAEEAATANKAKSEFLASMSHELRTPLNAILGFSEILQNQILGPLDSKYREYAGHVHSSGQHLLDLINDVLDLSKIAAGKMELRPSTFPVNELLQETMMLVRKPADRDLTVNLQRSPEPVSIFADRRLIKQILLNLLSNALKFTPSGGKVVLGVGVFDTTGLELFVADTGIGMSKQDLEKAFSEYGQVDSKVARPLQGTGLGLPIAKSLAQLHGGDLLAKSAPGQGTRMSLVIPANRVSAREAA